MTRVVSLLLLCSCAPVVGSVEPQDTSLPDGLERDRVWSARWLIGGLDRVVIHGSQDQQPSCLLIRLVAPGFDGSPYDEVTINEPWGIEVVGSSTEPCDPRDGWGGAADQASSVTGQIQVEGPDWPTDVTLDLEITFNGGGRERVDIAIELDDG